MANSGSVCIDVTLVVHDLAPLQNEGVSSLYPSYPDAERTPGILEKTGKLSMFLICTVEAVHSHGLVF